MLFSGTWGKMIHEKTLSKKSCETVPLKEQFQKIPEIGNPVADSLGPRSGNFCQRYRNLSLKIVF